MATRPLVVVNVPGREQVKSNSENRSSTSNMSSISADKALQYTPFTTSVVSASHRIPIPEVSRVREDGRVATSNERRLAQALMQQKDLQPAIQNHIAALLNRDQSLQFHFRLAPTPNASNNPSANSLPDLALSPLARSVLNMTNPQYRYPTPDDDNTTIAACSPKDVKQITTHTPASVRPPPSSTQTVAGSRPPDSKARITASTPSRPVPMVVVPTPPMRTLTTPASAISSTSTSRPSQPRQDSVRSQSKASFTNTPRSQPLVKIPLLSADHQREDFTTIEHSPKKRKLSNDESYHAQNQKQQSDEALQSFEDLLRDIFEAQDSLDVSGGHFLNAKAATYFEIDQYGEEPGFLLNHRALDKLCDELKKLLNLNRLQNVSLHALRRLQQLCEPAIERCQTINLRLSDDGEEAIVSWRSNTTTAGHGLVCATVCLYTMLGNPQEEQLISSDVLRWATNTLVNVLENFFIPIVEARPDANDITIFRQAASITESAKHILNLCKVLLDVVATACISVTGGDALVNTIEFLAAKLVFAQNASTDKGSALGNVQVYENFRKSAMASLSRLYARFPRERSAILDEVLTSLDKLPSTSRSARNYRAGNGKAIQLISALFMQLVQTTSLDMSASESHKARTQAHRKNLQESDDEEAVEGSGLPNKDQATLAIDTSVLGRLDAKVKQMFDPAHKSAQEIGLYLVSRASKTTKSGDSPYRNILDLFIEDLINVLDSPEWPSADLILNVLVAKMLDLAQNEKAASIKNMALESLGNMGSAISRLRAHLPALVGSIGKEDSEAATELARLGQIYSQNGFVPYQELLNLQGPFMMIVSFFLGTSKKSLVRESARAYFVAHLGHLVSQAMHNEQNQVDLHDVAEQTIQLFSSSPSVTPRFAGQVSREVADVAFSICILHQRFCRRLYDIGKALSSSLSSEQAQVRSRSLKSVAVMLEIDSSLLTRDASIADDVFRCASDDSAMVRDSALSLIARFIIPKGGIFERKGIERLLECTKDEKIGVQKRSIGHLKDYFLQEKRDSVKLRIAQKFMLRLDDHETTIASLAEQTLENIWIEPVVFRLSSDETAALTIVAIEDLVSQIIACVIPDTQTFMPLLKKFLVFLLGPSNKSHRQNHRLCGKLVQSLFDKIITADEGRSPLIILTALADADPHLVPAPQLTKLQIYLSDLQSKNTDLLMFRSAVGIFRLVLPNLSETHKTLLKDIQDQLMRSISMLPRRQELDAVMQCLSSIDDVLQNTARLVRLAGSVLDKLASPKTPTQALVSLLQIAGALGKHVDFDKNTSLFAQLVPAFKARTVAAHICAILLPRTAVGQDLNVRAVALESLGSVCQTSPAQFNSPRISSTFFAILKPSAAASDFEDSKLKAVVINIFDELYAARAAAKGKLNQAEDGEEQALKQIGGNAKSRDQDSAISGITMDVVDAVLRISMTETTSNALSAARTLASISQQGLVHPKQCLGAFVAFGTSTDPSIALIGHKAQRLLHEQHESHCEREYTTATTQAFKYQADVLREPCGARYTEHTGLRPKLEGCFEIINTSNSKYVKKFLSGILSRTALDMGNHDKSLVPIEHVLFTRFIVHNVAFFEYRKVDELLHIVLQLELTYSKNGGEVAQMIEAAFAQHPDLVVHTQSVAVPELGVAATVVESKATNPGLIPALKPLSTAAACLMLLIETRSHLLRQYGLGRDVRAAMTNNKQAKDTNKSPTKVHGITGEKFWTKSNLIVSSLEHELSMVELCKEFVGAMSVDDGFDMADDQAYSGDVPTNNDLYSAQKISTPGGRKRKRSSTPGINGTPTKRSRGRPRKSVQRRSSSVSTVHEDLDDDFAG